MSTTLEIKEKRISCVPTQTNWYIFYTAPRAEKIVYNDLLNREYDVFLPTTKTLKEWKNRQKKVIEEVLFPSYIFVNTHEHELYKINRVPRIASCICCSGKPSVVSLNDIETIKKMISLDHKISLVQEFVEGERVRITFGPLKGHEGTLILKKGKARFGIQLREINHTIMIEINAGYLQKIKN